MFLKNKRVIGILLLTGLLLLVPFVAMQFTTEVIWTLSDFIIAGIVLLSTGFICELVLRNVRGFKQRIIICGIVLLLLALTWIELAVGIFGTPFAGK